MDLNVQLKWQHLIIIVSVVAVPFGTLYLIAVLNSHPPGGPDPWWPGVLMIGVSLPAGVAAVRSLQLANRKMSLERQRTAGFFELDPSAPTAMIDFNAQIAEHFALPLPQVRKPMPATFAQLVPIICKAATASGTIFPAQYDAARAALSEALSQATTSIPWSISLKDLIPGGKRRYRIWQHLRGMAPGLPVLIFNPWIENFAIYGLLAALIGIAVPIAQRMDRSDSTAIHSDDPMTRVGDHALGLIVFSSIIAVLMIPIRIVGRRYASRIPAPFDRFTAFASQFSSESQTDIVWTPRTTVDHLRDLVRQHLQINQVSNETSIWPVNEPRI